MPRQETSTGNIQRSKTIALVLLVVTVFVLGGFAFACSQVFQSSTQEGGRHEEAVEPQPASASAPLK